MGKTRGIGAGGIQDEREAGRAGGVSSERAGSGRNRGKLCNNASYFVIEKGFKKRVEGENGKLEKTRGLDFSVPSTLNTS